MVILFSDSQAHMQLNFCSVTKKTLDINRIVDTKSGKFSVILSLLKKNRR